MKKVIRCAAFLLLLCALLTAIPVIPAQAANPLTVYQLNTYKNTGNQRQDIVGVALTQVGYKEKPTNDTLYGDWYSLTHDEWCAMFVSWCARQAEIPQSVLPKAARAHPNAFQIPYKHGSTYTPQPGDLFFTERLSHVGIVWYVDGDYFYTIEGNTNPDSYYDPNDYSGNAYFVAIRKRTIRQYYFGIPAYNSGTAEHDYVRKVESQHPHNVYYECTTCGNKNYTGYTDVLSTCDTCFRCGCDTESAGWYEVVCDQEYLKLRSDHYGSRLSNYVTPGSVVYVYGTHQSSNNAYIEYYGLKGHIPLNYLRKYPDPPEAPTFTMEKTNWLPGTKAELAWTTPENTELFRLQLYKDGVLYEEQQLTEAKYEPLLPEGSYELRVTADNRAGQSPVSTTSFTVRTMFYITLDLQDGNDPQIVDQPPEEPFTPPALTREGYTLLGWTDVAGSNIVIYPPETVFNITQDRTFYAVWTAEDSQPESLVIQSPFTTTQYLVGEEFSAEGLVLNYMYSDGAGVRITEGYTIEGFDPDTPSEQTLTISYEGLSVTTTVNVIAYIPGDMDGSKTVDRDDVMALLWHVNFPAMFQIYAPADFDHNDSVDRDDVMTLLWYVNFPDLFPLESTPSDEGA